jgi:integrase
MSALRDRLDEYLSVRRSLGFKLVEEARLLSQFVAHLEEHQVLTVTTEIALEWSMLSPSRSRSQGSKRLGMVRGFAKHLLALDPATQVPPAQLLPNQPHRAIPFIYSDLDIQRLQEEARKIRTPLRAGTYVTLIGLLATTGMRVGEVIRLDRKDVDMKNGVLTVRDSKFGKSREVPLHESTVQALRTYARRRARLCPHPKSPAFLVSTPGTRLIYKNVQHVYIMLTRRAGLTPRSPSCRPRIHDLRHTFAVRTVLEWYRASLDVETRLPLLSTYLGHSAPASTYWYLSATPELMALASQRLEQASGGAS